MLKRCLVFGASFLILEIYLRMTGFLMKVGNSALFMICEFLLALGIYLLARKLQIFEFRKLRINDWLVYLGGFVAYLLSLGLTEFIPVSSGNTRFVSTGDLSSLIFLTYVCVFAPLMEEMMFRGVIQNGVFKNSYVGILVASIAFSIMHEPDNVLSFIPYFLVALILGYMYKCSDSLAPSILLHFTINTLFLIHPFFH